MELTPVDLVTDVALPQASDFIIYPWVYPGRLTLVTGPTEIGKTTLTLEMIAACIKGEHLWDRFPCRKIDRILYLHGEHTIATLQEAAKARGDLPPGMVHVVHEFGESGPVLINPDGRPNLELIRELRRLTLQLKPQLIIAEPISAFLASSENDNREARFVVHFLSNLGAKVGAAVLTHHHVGKAHFDTERQRPEAVPFGESRGAMAFEDAAEKVLYLRRMKTKETGDNIHKAHIKISTPKPKGFPVDDVVLSFDDDTLSYSYINSPLSERDLISVYTRRRKQPNEPINEMVEHFRTLWKCSPNRIMLMLKRAKRVGLLDEAGKVKLSEISSQPSPSPHDEPPGVEPGVPS